MPKERAGSEEERLAALRRYDVLDTPNEAEFDDIVRIAARICDTPMALISLVDDGRQWFKATIGLGISETPRGIAFCAHAIEQEDVFVVDDASRDGRFAANPLVTADPNLRFYAGAPLQTSDGFRLGTLCVLDRNPRKLTPDQLEALAALSRQVVSKFEFRRTLKENQRLLEEKDLLMQEMHHRVANSLAMVQSLLMLQARAAKDEAAASQLRESAGRIHIFAAMHERLYRVGAASQVDISVYLQKLIDDQRAAFGSVSNGRDITFVAANILWPSADAPTLGMILVELVTNALKYGCGTVSVSLGHKDGEVVLTVEDEGTALSPDFDPLESKGLGMRIVAGLLRGRAKGGLTIDRTRKHTCFVASLKIPETNSLQHTAP